MTKRYFTTESTGYAEEQKRGGAELSPEILGSLVLPLCSPCSLW
jgi:hypothetical protein